MNSIWIVRSKRLVSHSHGRIVPDNGAVYIEAGQPRERDIDSGTCSHFIQAYITGSCQLESGEKTLFSGKQFDTS